MWWDKQENYPLCVHVCCNRWIFVCQIYFYFSLNDITFILLSTNMQKIQKMWCDVMRQARKLPTVCTCLLQSLDLCVSNLFIFFTEWYYVPTNMHLKVRSAQNWDNS